MLGSGLAALFVGCSPAAMAAATAAFPLAAGAGFLLWIGIAVTASAFAPDQGRPSGRFASAAAVAMGLVPVLANWGAQLVVASAAAARGGALSKTLEALAAQGVNVRGLAALAQGSLLSSVSLAATLATILERHFGAAAGWCALNAALSALGFIHAFRVEGDAVVADVGGLVLLRNSGAAQAAFGYALAATLPRGTRR